jgi:hypothetical protein
MESEGDEIQSKQASKRDRTLTYFFDFLYAWRLWWTPNITATGDLQGIKDKIHLIFHL